MQLRRFARAGFSCLAVLATAGLLPGVAQALQPSAATVNRPRMELVSGANAALAHEVVWDQALTPSTKAAMRKLEAEVGPVRASFNTQTGVPSRLWGSGFPAAGSIADAKTAEALSRSFLSKHADLLAPGSDVSVFELASNDLDLDATPTLGAQQGVRSVGLQQVYVTRKGQHLAVRGGQVSFRFKNDRMTMVGSEAIPLTGVDLELPASALSESTVARAAIGFVERDFGAGAVTDGPASEAFVLPFTNASGQIELRVVRSVVVTPAGVVGRFEVFVDATSGAALARQQLLHFGTGRIAFHVPDRSPSYGDRTDKPAQFALVGVDAASLTADASGGVTFAGAGPVTANVFSRGPEVLVQNQDGANSTTDLTLTDGGTSVWDASTDELVDAQLDAFIHAYQVREYAKSFAPSLSFLQSPVEVNVNISDVCNAYSDGTTINFFKSGSGCENTGRIADVTYHEFGHSIHAHAIIPGVGAFDGALSEGIADYLAGTITGDHGMGRGFFFSTEPLRDLDPPDHKNHWPEDLQGEEHEDGKIIGQTLWELRKELITKLGETEGVQQANKLFYEGIRRAVDIPSMYPEVLAADDDDGNLENGTPNVCEINHAFALHGIRAYSVQSSPLSLEAVKQEGYNVTAQLNGLFAECPDDNLDHATLSWRNRDEPSESGNIDMMVSGNQLAAVIPTQPTDSVVEYSLSVAFAATDGINLPDNAADPWYQFYIGDVEPIYCTDFETDPTNDGWTHGLSKGQVSDGADDWEWGMPKGTSTNGDPTDAFDGKRVFGNDLGIQVNHNGLYQSDKTNYAMSPMIDTTGYAEVRLQYRRWLNVEDAHFDQATIYANDEQAWQNLDSDNGDQSNTQHTDREWRFHDIDLTPYVKNNQVQIKYEIASDQGLNMGGWTLDAFCVVGAKKSDSPDPCLAGACDDGGNPVADPMPKEKATTSGGCACSIDSGEEGNAAGALVGLSLLGLVVARRRRSRA